MRSRPRAITLPALGAALVASLAARPSLADEAPSPDLQKAIDKSVAWIAAHQNPDGGYGPFGEKEKARVKDASDVGITAFALDALAKDPLVADAFAWISKDFTVLENPGMATKANPKASLQGLYYYYHTMAKALSVFGLPLVKDEKGVDHDWARELGAQLMWLQGAEGFWKSTSERWYEEIPVLETSFAVVEFVECQSSIQKAAAR